MLYQKVTSRGSEINTIEYKLKYILEFFSVFALSHRTDSLAGL